MVDVMYTVKARRDESGAWIASVPDVPGCHTHGRSLGQVKNRIREALSLWVDDAEEADLELDVRLPPGLRQCVKQVAAARQGAEEAAGSAAEASERAVALLMGESDLSLRDVAELLGISHQRVHQIASRS